MLTITVPGTEAFNEDVQEFITQGDFVLELEHSLVSLSKWESKYEKPFLGETSKEPEEILDYIKLMVLTPEVPEGIYLRLSQENFQDIEAYIEAKMTATWFSDAPASPRVNEAITSELIYYWLTLFNIPFTCENWHLNRLFTLINVCNVKQMKPKKMSRAEIAERNRELNARRKAQHKTTG